MRNDPDAVMLFAAGFGTRMGKLTKNRPKPLIKVAGRALFDHALEQVDGARISHKVTNCHYFPDQIRAHLSTRPDVHVVTESGAILETGGGLKNALPVLGNQPVFTMNTDAVWCGPNALEFVKSKWKPDQMDALLLCVSRKSAIGHTGAGDFIYGENNTISYGPGDVFTGLQIIKTDRLSEITDTSFSLKLLWEKMFEVNRVFGVQYPGHWCDVGSPEGIESAEQMLDVTDV